MKNFTKQNFKTNPLWIRLLIMAFMLLLGSSSAWARTFSKGDVLFIDATNCSWYEGDGCNASIYFWGTNTIGPVHTTRISDRLYCYTFTSAVNVSNFKVFRQPTSSSGWDNQYNGFESDFNSMGTHNTIKINGNSDGYSWADYKPTSTGKLTASSTDVKTGESVTLTPSLTSNTTYNTIKSTTYSISPSSGANISGSTFTATEAGKYTVTATITYNPKGYSSLTSTVKPTVQITVTSSCTPPTLTLSKTSADANKGDDVNLTTLSGATASSGTVEWYTTENSTTATSASVTVSETKTYYARAVGDCKSDAKSFEINAKCTKDFYLVGASADIFGSEWSPAQVANKMNCDLNTLTKTYTNITVAANTTVEYKYTGANGWSDAEYPTSGNASFTIQTAGTYNITFTASTNGTSITGTPTVTWELSCDPVQASQYTISTTEYTYDGTAKKPTVSANTADAGTPTSTVYKQGDTEVENPINVGTYDVYVSSNDGTTYCGANNLLVGSFEIKCKEGTASSLYTLTDIEFEYNGAPRHPGIDVAPGAGTVASIVYKQGDTEVASPINVGSYDVYITSNAGTGYCEITTPTKIGTFEVTCRTATASQYTISTTLYTYDGSAKKPTVSKASGAAGEVTNTVYKQGDTTVDNPINAGTYDIYITTGAGTGYCALTNFKLGSFTIKGKDPVDSDFTYTNSKNYTGSALSADVAWKTGLAAGVGGAITTYYKVEGAADNTYTTTVPTAVGTYIVAVTTAAGGNYAAATQKIVLGEFTINEVCDPITNLTWTITSGAKATYCPGDEVTVTMTYNGSTAKGYEWGGNYSGNIGISGGSIANGAQYTMTINKSGSVNLTLTDCDNKTPITPTLEFTTHETPATPTILFSVNPVGQSKETILSIASYNANNNYIVYSSADNAVGNDTEVGTYTAPMSIRHNDTGSYYYYAKATNKSCANLTATSAIVKLDVQEAGAIIAALGDLKVDPQDPVDFVAMYVKNDGKSDFGATSVTGYTWQFSNDDGNTWTDCASTNVVDGVNYELGMENGSANCNNFRPNIAGTYRCVVEYNTGDTQNSNYLTVTSDGSTDKTFKDVTMTLPVVSVNTGDGNFPVNDFGGTPSKNASSDKMKAKISVDVKIFENINGTTQVVYDRKARMNYRGSSSMNFLKKSYAFCPGDEMCGDKKGIDYVKTKKLNMLGIGNALDKDWVLYAAAADPSLMRNRLMFDTFADMTGGWSVSSRYVELVVNGEYKGVYVMMDKITANKDRVNVEWKLDANGNTTQEAFIVKFDKTDRADRYEDTSGDQKTFKSKYSGHDGFDTYDTNIDQRFEVEYPEKEDIEDGKGKWSEVFNAIENKINKFEEELAKGNFSEVQKLIDYTSWADWFIITEFAKNIDGYRASNIFVYDGSKANAKIEARPLWDQELSFNNQCPSYYDSYGSSNTSGLLIDKNNSAVYDNDASAPFWFTGKYKGDRGKYNGSGQTFKGLLDDPCFQAEVQARWAIHTGAGGALTSDKMVNMMKGYLADLDKDHVLNSSTIHAGTPLDREFNTFWKNKSRATIDCGTGSGCYSGSTGYTDTGFHNSKVSLNNWLTGSRRTNLGNIINGWEGTELNITLTITPATGITTPWEAVMVQVNNPSGYDYDLEYTTNTLDKVSGVIINENNDKYTYRIPRPEAWKPGDEEKDGERTDIQYGIKATLKVGEGMAQCGNSSQAPSATTTITLQDEANENCPK